MSWVWLLPAGLAALMLLLALSLKLSIWLDKRRWKMTKRQANK